MASNKRRRGWPASMLKPRLSKASRQQRNAEAIKAAKTDVVEFLRRICGFEVQPWQALVIRAMMEDKL